MLLRLCLYVLTLTGTCLLLCLPAHGQIPSKASTGDLQKADEDRDNIAIVELGASTSWNLRGGEATSAPNLAAEVTPIENWLELEAGVSPFYTRRSTEWDTDLLFKKPWTLSRKAEFMLGVGPEWVHLNQNGKVAGDFHVLADRQTPFRLVPRTGLRLELRTRPPAIHRYEWWSPHRGSVRGAMRERLTGALLVRFLLVFVHRFGQNRSAGVREKRRRSRESHIRCTAAAEIGTGPGAWTLHFS
jgi:hypothetical protein